MVETDGEWLVKQFEDNLDLRSPKKPHDELFLLDKVPNVTIRENGNLIGFCTMNRRIGCIELCSLVVDKMHRGKGISHEILYSAWDRWRQDPIIHGNSVIPVVDLSAAMRNEQIEAEVVVQPMIAFTRNVAAAAAFTRAGFKMMIPKRRWWTLWLFRHRYGALQTKVMISILLNRIFRGGVIFLVGERLPKNIKRENYVKRWFQRRRRIFHFLMNSKKFELFILESDKVDVPPIRTDKEEQHIDLKIESFGMSMISGNEFVKKGAGELETKNKVEEIVEVEEGRQFDLF